MKYSENYFTNSGKIILLLFVTMIIFIVNVSAQIEGDVVDQKDNGIRNAIVIAIDTLRNIADTVKTNERGFYIFKTLKKGNYKIEVKAAGFLTALFQNVKVIKDISIPVDEERDVTNATRLDITLKNEKGP